MAYFSYLDPFRINIRICSGANATMVSFVKLSSYNNLVRQSGVRRMKKTCRKRFHDDLEAYVVLLDSLARRIAYVQGRRIVKKEHVELALKALENTKLR